MSCRVRWLLLSKRPRFVTARGPTDKRPAITSRGLRVEWPTCRPFCLALSCSLAVGFQELTLRQCSWKHSVLCSPPRAGNVLETWRLVRSELACSISTLGFLHPFLPLSKPLIALGVYASLRAQSLEVSTSHLVRRPRETGLSRPPHQPWVVILTSAGSFQGGRRGPLFLRRASHTIRPCKSKFEKRVAAPAAMQPVLKPNRS